MPEKVYTKSGTRYKAKVRWQGFKYYLGTFGNRERAVEEENKFRETHPPFQGLNTHTLDLAIDLIGAENVALLRKHELKIVRRHPRWR